VKHHDVTKESTMSFFKDWRRNAGVVLIGLAIAIAASRVAIKFSGHLPPQMFTGRGLWQVVVMGWEIVFRVNEHPGARIQPRPNRIGGGGPDDAIRTENRPSPN
jgi:hypothetical protein